MFLTANVLDERRFMKDKFLTSTIALLVLALASALILPNRSISGFMQACGGFISDLFGF